MASDQSFPVYHLMGDIFTCDAFFNETDFDFVLQIIMYAHDLVSFKKSRRQLKTVSCGSYLNDFCSSKPVC